MAKNKRAAIFGVVLGAVFTMSSAFAAVQVITDEPVNIPKSPAVNAPVEEQMKWKKEFTEWAEKEKKVKHYAGEKTKGTEITINEAPVKLPNDVYLEGLVVEDQGLERKEEYHKHLPFYVIKSGNSTIAIAQRTGMVVNQSIDPNDKAPFKFLEKHISGYIAEVQR